MQQEPNIILAGLIDLVEKNEQVRIQAIEDSFRLYDGRHSEFFPRFEAEEDDDFRKRIKLEAYNINFLSRVVDILSEYLYGKEVQRRCKNDKAQKLMEELWDRTAIHLYMLGRKVTGAIAGTSYTVARWLPKWYEKRNVETDIPIRYDPVDPAYVTLIYDRADPTRVKGVVIHYLFDDITGVTVVDRHRSPTSPLKHYVEYITDDEWLIWIDERLQDGKNGQEDLMNWEAWEGANPFGSVDTVFTVYRNFEFSRTPYGISDIKHVINLNLKYDERKTDEGVSIGYHGSPALVGDFEMDDLIRGPNRVWQIPPERKLEYLTWDNDISASLSHSDRIRLDMLAMGYLPEAALFAEGVKQLRSAPALELAFAPAKGAIMRQRMSYEKAEKQRIKGDLRMLQVMGRESFDDVDVEITWPQKFLPIDSFVEIETSRVRRELGLDTWDDQILRDNPGMSDEEIEEHKKKCEEDPLFGKGGGSVFSSPAEKSLEQEEPVRAPGGAGE